VSESSITLYAIYAHTAIGAVTKVTGAANCLAGTVAGDSGKLVGKKALKLRG